jgi:hypothetical protein
MTSRTLVSPRSKILSIISASWVVTSASPGSIWSSAFSSSRETNARVSPGRCPVSRISEPTTALAVMTRGASTTVAQVRGRYILRMRLVAHSRATALGITSPKISITGVRAAVTTRGA